MWPARGMAPGLLPDVAWQAWATLGTQLPFTKSSWHTAGQQVPADQLVNGSVLLVKPGVGVPEDGVIVSGASRVDESMLTGESAPMKKSIDDQVNFVV